MDWSVTKREVFEDIFGIKKTGKMLVFFLFLWVILCYLSIHFSRVATIVLNAL